MAPLATAAAIACMLGSAAASRVGLPVRAPVPRPALPRMAAPSPDSPDDWKSERALRSRKHTELYTGLAAGAGETSGNAGAAPRSEGAAHASPPEILAPAGGWPQLRAAIAAGADACYFGCAEGLNARARASNFGLDELGDVMRELHEHGMRGYLCVNVLVFDEELASGAPERLIRAAAEAGVDALIVQDAGVAQLARRVAPELEVHASTQQSVTDGYGALHAVRTAGASTVVVGRELSLDEVAAVRSTLDAHGHADVALEVFVHGALCVSYSGQCFSSEAWGGRSANRGQCAQACRMPYGLLVDGALHSLLDQQYLLSPQDLCALDLVPQLVRAGARTLKIEGRLKGPEYVYATTRAYRAAVDEAWAALAPAPAAEPTGARADEASAAVAAGGAAAVRERVLDPWVPSRPELAALFARAQDARHDGLSAGFLNGPRHQSLVRARTPGHRGVLVGSVAARPRTAPAAAVAVELAQSVRRGDGVVFDEPSAYEAARGELGGAVYDVLDPTTSQPVPPDAQEAGRTYLLTFATESGGALGSVRPGQHVWRTRDASVEKAVASRLARADELGRERVRVRVRGALGAPLTLELTDVAGRRAEGRTQSALQRSTRDASGASDAADGDALAAAALKAVGDLGGTALALGSADAAELAPGLHVPLREIKAARRAALDALLEARRAPPPRAAPPHAEGSAGGEGARPAAPAARARRSAASPSRAPLAAVRLSVLCRTPAQVEALTLLPAAVRAGSAVDEIVCDHLEMRGMEASVARVRASGLRAVVAAPRVIKPAEAGLWRVLADAGADAILVRSAGLLLQLAHERSRARPEDPLSRVALHGDFSLGVANADSARLLLDSGLERVTPTHDCNSAQLEAIARRLGADGARRIEPIVHTHVPIFHTDYCVFARTLSEGESYRDCGHPCERHSLHLRTAEGADNLVLADMGCRNTVFNAEAQSGARHVRGWADAGITRLRIELVDEPAHVAVRLVQAYMDLLAGAATHDDIFDFVRREATDSNGRLHGVGEGSLRVKREREWSSLKRTARG